MVKISVQNSEGEVQDFHVDSNVICNASPYFYAKFKEIVLPESHMNIYTDGEMVTVQYEASHEAFKLLVDYAYTHHYCPNATAPKDQDFICTRARNLFFGTLIELWILAQNVEMPDLCHETMERLSTLAFEMTAVDNHFPATHLKFIYDNTVEGSPLRTFIIQMANSYFSIWQDLHTSTMLDFIRIAPREMICDTRLAMLNRSGSRGIF